MKHIFSILMLLCFTTASNGQSCEVDGIFHSSFEDVKAILEYNNCSSCHANQSQLGGWNFDTYLDFLRPGDCNKQMVLHGDAANSHFYTKLSGGEACGESGDNHHRISSEELNQIESWINFGAPEFCVSFYTEIRSILDNNGCNNCHGHNNAQAWRYDSYVNIFDKDLDNNCSEQEVIVRGNSAASLLYDKINNDGFVACGDAMNASSGPMSYEDVARIRDWINSEAIETAASLPVILNFFTATFEQEEVRLRWSTEAEIGTDKFLVERSSTGMDFETITEVNSEGSATLGDMYSIEDLNPIIGDNYYRLKIVDLDGTFNYSNIRRVRVKSEETIVTVFPNPAIRQDRLTVKWLPRANEESTYLNIVDMNGQNLHRKIIFEGTNYVRLPTLLDGVYYVIVEDLFGGFILERVVIIN
ncbi:MAG: T9SS type A sorting domain-containing protein [Bacteroidota bacterium]